jgi:hypothetical protein
VSSSIAAPVIAGLAVGIAFVVLFSSFFLPLSYNPKWTGALGTPESCADISRCPEERMARNCIGSISFIEEDGSTKTVNFRGYSDPAHCSMIIDYLHPNAESDVGMWRLDRQECLVPASWLTAELDDKYGSSLVGLLPDIEDRYCVAA